MFVSYYRFQTCSVDEVPIYTIDYFGYLQASLSQTFTKYYELLITRTLLQGCNIVDLGI